jgi:hypothetical protein
MNRNASRRPAADLGVHLHRSPGPGAQISVGASHDRALPQRLAQAASSAGRGTGAGAGDDCGAARVALSAGQGAGRRADRFNHRADRRLGTARR